MQVVVNGEIRELDEAVTVAGLLELLAVRGRRIAVEINEEILPRSQHGKYRLRDGDRVEVVGAIGGG